MSTIFLLVEDFRIPRTNTWRPPERQRSQSFSKKSFKQSTRLRALELHNAGQFESRLMDALSSSHKICVRHPYSKPILMCIQFAVAWKDSSQYRNIGFAELRVFYGSVLDICSQKSYSLPHTMKILSVFALLYFWASPVLSCYSYKRSSLTNGTAEHRKLYAANIYKNCFEEAGFLKTKRTAHSMH